MRQIEDPALEGKKALLFEVFLARESEWPLFKVLEELIRAVKEVGDL